MFHDIPEQRGSGGGGGIFSDRGGGGVDYCCHPETFPRGFRLWDFDVGDGPAFRNSGENAHKRLASVEDAQRAGFIGSLVQPTEPTDEVVRSPVPGPVLLARYDCHKAHLFPGYSGFPEWVVGRFERSDGDSGWFQVTNPTLGQGGRGQTEITPAGDPLNLAMLREFGVQCVFQGNGFNHDAALAVTISNMGEARICGNFPAGQLFLPADELFLQPLVLRDMSYVNLGPGESRSFTLFAYCGNARLGCLHGTRMVPAPLIVNFGATTSQLDVWAHLKPGPFISDRRPTRAEAAACLAMLQEARAMLQEASHHSEGHQLPPHMQGLADRIDASVVEVRPYSRGAFSWLGDCLPSSSFPWSFLDQGVLLRAGGFGGMAVFVAVVCIALAGTRPLVAYGACALLVVMGVAAANRSMERNAWHDHRRGAERRRVLGGPRRRLQKPHDGRRHAGSSLEWYRQYGRTLLWKGVAPIGFLIVFAYVLFVLGSLATKILVWILGGGGGIASDAAPPQPSSTRIGRFFPRRSAADGSATTISSPSGGIAVDRDQDGDVDLEDIKASLAIKSEDALVKIRAYIDELGDGDGVVEGSDIFSTVAKFCGAALVLVVAAYALSEHRMRARLARVPTDCDALYVARKEREIAHLQRVLEGTERRHQDQRQEAERRLAAAKEEVAAVKRERDGLLLGARRRNRDDGPSSSSSSSDRSTQQQRWERRSAEDAARQLVETRHAFLPRDQGYFNSAAVYESTIRSLRREVRELESVVRDLLSAQQASPHPVGGSNLSPSRPPFGGFQVAFPPNLLQATSPESPSRKPFLFRNEPTLSVSNLVWNSLWRDEFCLDPVYFPDTFEACGTFQFKKSGSNQLGGTEHHSLQFFKLMAMPQEANDGGGGYRRFNVGDAAACSERTACIAMIIHDPRYDSPPWSIPKPRPGQPPFRFWLMKSTSPKTPGMDAQQFKRLIDQWGDDSGVTAEEPITEWIGYLRPNASRQQQLSDVIKIYEWSDLHPQHQICYT